MGQLNELYHYARTHNVRHIVLAVGANDFDFSGVTKQCMELYEKAKWLIRRPVLLQLRRHAGSHHARRSGTQSRTTSTTR